MGQLLDYLQQSIDVCKTLKEKENVDFERSRKMDFVYPVFKEGPKLTQTIAFINNNAQRLFGNDEKFKQILKQATGQDLEKIPDILIKGLDLNAIDSVEKIMIEMDRELGPMRVNEIIEDGKQHLDVVDPKYNHSLDTFAANLKADMDNLGLSEEQKTQYTEALDYAVEEITFKASSDIAESMYEAIAYGRNQTAIEEFRKYSDSNGGNTQVLIEQSSITTLTFSPRDTTRDAVQPLINTKFVVSNDLKQKIKGLQKVMEDNKVMENAQAGESKNKGYAFTKYFNTANELKKLVVKDTTKLSQEEKKQHALNIINASNNLKTVTQQYQNVIDYIKQNFNETEISLPNNVYSGRDPLYDDINNRNPSMPAKWDSINLVPGVIMNGFVQMKIGCDFMGVTIDQFLDNPTEFSLNYMENKVKDAYQTIILPKEEPLGKRIAHQMWLPSGTGSEILTGPIMVVTRGAEFLSNIEMDPVQKKASIYQESLMKYKMENTDYDPFTFGVERSKYNESAKVLFLEGENTENLYTLSDRYYDNNLKKNTYNYEKALEAKQSTALDEYKKVQRTLLDFVKETDTFSGNAYLMGQRVMNTGTLTFYGQQYLVDYMAAHNLTLNPDNPEEKKAIEFLRNPVKSLYKDLKAEMGPNYKSKDPEDRVVTEYNLAKGKCTDRVPQYFDRNRQKIVDDMINKCRRNGTTPEEKYEFIKNEIREYVLKYRQYYSDNTANSREMPNVGLVVQSIRDYYVGVLIRNDIILDDSKDYIKDFIRDPVNTLFTGEQAVIRLAQQSREQIQSQYIAAREEKIDAYRVQQAENANKLVSNFRTNNKHSIRDMNLSINETIERNKPGFWETIFRRTSREYKDFVKVMQEVQDPNHKNYGDLKKAYAAAKRYIQYKLPGVAINSEEIRNAAFYAGVTGGQRALFALTTMETTSQIINSIDTSITRELKGINNESPIADDFQPGALEVEASNFTKAIPIKNEENLKIGENINEENNWENIIEQDSSLDDIHYFDLEDEKENNPEEQVQIEDGPEELEGYIYDEQEGLSKD